MTVVLHPVYLAFGLKGKSNTWFSLDETLLKTYETSATEESEYVKWPQMV